MSAIIARVSAVNTFLTDTVTQYRQLTEQSYAVLRSMEQMAAYVESKKSKLQRQTSQLLELESKIHSKLYKLSNQLQETQETRYYYRSEYRSATDSQAANYWQEQYDLASKQYYALNERYEYAYQISKDIARRKEQFQTFTYAIRQIEDAMQRNVYATKSIIAALEDETNYNAQALSTVIQRLESYTAAVPFGVTVATSAGYSSYASGSSASSSKKKKPSYKLSNKDFGYDSDGNRHLYKLYFPQAQPVKGMLYDIMRGLRHDMREAIMKELEFVEFQSARHGFIYSNGKRKLRVIGVDISDPTFNHFLLMHVGHELYELRKADEKRAFEKFVTMDIEANARSADHKIRQMAMDFRPVDSVKQYNKHSGFTFKSAGSRFFSECFKAYVANDYHFLNVAKEHFGNSYNAFAEIINRLPNR